MEVCLKKYNLLYNRIIYIFKHLVAFAKFTSAIPFFSVPVYLIIVKKCEEFDIRFLSSLNSSVFFKENNIRCPSNVH